MVVSVFGSSEHLGRVLEAHYLARGTRVIPITHAELDATATPAEKRAHPPRAHSGLETRLLDAGVSICIFVAELPAPRENGPPVWIDTFTSNVLRAELAMASSRKPLSGVNGAKFVVISDTPVRKFPHFDLQRGASMISNVRSGATASARTAAKRLAVDGISIVALHHPDLGEGATRPTDIPDAAMAEGIEARIEALSIETSGLVESFGPVADTV